MGDMVLEAFARIGHLKNVRNITLPENMVRPTCHFDLFYRLEPQCVADAVVAGERATRPGLAA